MLKIYALFAICISVFNSDLIAQTSTQKNNKERVHLDAKELKKPVSNPTSNEKYSYDATFDIVEVAKKHYSPEEIKAMPLQKKKMINYLYKSSFTINNKNVTGKCKDLVDKFDVSSYNMKRKPNERSKISIDASCGIYVELFSQTEVNEQMELIKKETK